MADNVSTGVANSILGLILSGSPFAGFSTVYAKLHTGAPGSAGTANPAGNTTRQAVTFGTPSGGVANNNAAVNWTAVSTSETYTHVSLWDSTSGGTFVASGSVTAAAILAGQNFQIPSGGMSVTLPVAS